ncbi:MAG: tRNA threonylcarbamoyladenosine dehydratase [Polaromonas sp.]|nr:tRNA threonylcarbamoyladenosine dehydratase [Polaromonas sp.]MBA4261716.1 tRNA threonylcarbamoyladenosine dehydratase [Comamonadaceae bacterium]
MTEGFERRFGGLRRLYGVAGAQRIFDAHVVVVGIGGVGSWAVEALARSGVRRLTLIDTDHVSESNINRQIHALEPSLGQSKAQAMRERIALFHPDCQVHVIDDFVTPDNWPALLADDPAAPAALIDACDQVRAKTALAAWARCKGVPFVTVGAAGGKRLAQAVEVSDLADVTHDPLLAQLRYRLRKEHGAARSGRMGCTCVFSREAVAPPDASCSVDAGDGSLNCHGYGSVVSVTATFGLCAAGWVMNALAGSASSFEATSKHGKNDAII